MTNDIHQESEEKVRRIIDSATHVGVRVGVKRVARLLRLMNQDQLADQILNDHWDILTGEFYDPEA